MKRGNLAWQVILVLALVAVGYFCVFHFIERRRVAKGPWVVTFIAEGGDPAMVVNQPTLDIRDVRLVFAGERGATNTSQSLEFSEARSVPFAVPFGQCVFLDTLFLPGTVTFEMFGHQIQLLPRVLTIDHVEHAWRSHETIPLARATNQPAAAPPR